MLTKSATGTYPTPATSRSRSPNYPTISGLISYWDAAGLVMENAPLYVGRLKEAVPVAGERREWIGKLLLRVGAEMAKRLEARPKHPFSAGDLESWASCVVLREWTTDAFDYVYPVLFDPVIDTRRALPTVREWQAEIIRARNERRNPGERPTRGDAFGRLLRVNRFERSVAAALEEKRFRMERLIGPTTRPEDRMALVLRVLDYSYEGVQPRPSLPLFPHFIDKRGVSWDLPPGEGRSILDDLERGDAIRWLGWLSELRNPHPARKGTTLEEVTQATILRLRSDGHGPDWIANRLSRDPDSEHPHRDTIARFLKSVES